MSPTDHLRPTSQRTHLPNGEPFLWDLWPATDPNATATDRAALAKRYGPPHRGPSRSAKLRAVLSVAAIIAIPMAYLVLLLRS